MPASKRCCNRLESRDDSKLGRTATGFVRRHPFNPQLEIRRCFRCDQLWAVSVTRVKV